MSIPKTIKYTANGAVYDSMGSNSVQYVASYSTENAIYFLTSKNGDVTKWDFYSEQETSMKAITGSNDGSTYDVNSIVVKDGNVYGFRGRAVKKFQDNKVLYIEKSDTLLTFETFDFNTRSTDNIPGIVDSRQINNYSIKSTTTIEDFIVDSDDNIIMIHGDTNATITKFSNAFKKIYKINVASKFPEQSVRLLSIDIVREYTSTGLQQYPIALCLISGSQLALFKVDEGNETIKDIKLLGLTDQYISSNNKLAETYKPIYNLTNYTYLKENHPTQEFSFKLKLTNTQNNRDMLIVNIPVDVSAYTTGAHHFALRLDSIQGNISVFVDGNLYKNVTIPPGTYVFQDISQDGIAVGCTGFYDNVPLFKYLKQDNYYFVYNSYMKQFKLHNTALTDNEIRFLTYNGLHMQDSILSLPSDQRNELDQIERVFKLDVPSNKSNTVNILIKNSQISDVNIQEQLKTIISNRLQQILPANVNINEITFKSY